MDRRAALQLIGLGIASTRVGVAQEHLHALKAQPGAYKLQFFTAAEDRLRSTAFLMEISWGHPGRGWPLTEKNCDERRNDCRCEGMREKDGARSKLSGIASRNQNHNPHDSTLVRQTSNPLVSFSGQS